MNARAGVKARDVMRTDVVTLSADDTIRSALELFDDTGISGAPVVANGQLVGMLTLADLARTEHHADAELRTDGEYEIADEPTEALANELDPAEVFFSKEDYSPIVLGRTRVSDWMSRGVISVGPHASLAEACRVMITNQVHRVCVLEDRRLLGLLTSFDVVRHVARSGAPAAGRPRLMRAPRQRKTNGPRHVQ